MFYGYHLDDPSQWNEVASIPSEIEDKVESLFLSGYSIVEVKSSLPNEYKWVGDFMGAYHESLYIGRHGRW